MVRTLNADRSAAIKKRNTGASGTGRTRRGNVRMADTVLNSGNAEMGSRGRTRTGRRAQTTAGHTGRPAQARRSSHAVKPAAKGVNGVRVDEASLDASPSVPIRRTSAMSLHKVGFMIILIVVMTVLLINYIKLQADVTSSSQEIAAMEQQLTQLNLDDVSAITAWLGIIAAGMYVYFEFASISHMARGISLMLGIELPVNFDHPFAVRSINELVRKFNVSVTSWFTDYVYRPLTGNSDSRARTVCAAVLTGTATALWYGAKLPKLIFGAYIGLVCGTELILHKKSEKKLAYIPSMIITMGLFHIGLVLFICDDIVYALKYIPVMFGKNGMLIDNLTLYFFQNFFVLMLIGVFITSGLAKHLYEKLERSRRTFLPFLRPLSQLVLLVISTAFMSGAKQEYLGLFFN